MRNIPTKTDNIGDVLNASDFNANLRNELQTIATSAGYSLDPAGGPDTDIIMLSKAIARYAGAGAYYQDSGAANAYVLAIPTLLKAVDSYSDGLEASFVVGNTNTGASTVNLSTIGAKAIVLSDGAALSGGELISGAHVTVRYLAAGDHFVLAKSSNAAFLRLKVVNDVFALTKLTSLSDGDVVNIVGFFVTFPATKFLGNGALIWEASLNKNLADGGRIIDPATTGGFDGTIGTLPAFFAAQGTGVGTGCWVRTAADTADAAWYGLVSDGDYSTGLGTDNGPMINQAIQSNLPSITNGSAITVGAGIFIIGTRIEIPSGVSLIGTGKWSTQFVCKSAYASDIVIFNGVGGPPSSLRGMSVSAQTGGAFGAIGISMQANGSFVSDVWVNGLGTGILMASTDCFLDDFATELNTVGVRATSSNIGIANGTTYQNTQGVQIDNAAATEPGRVHVSNVRSTGDAQYGFVITNAQNVSLDSCSAGHVNAGQLTIAGVLVAGTSHDIAIDNFNASLGAVSTTSSGIYITDSAQRITVDGGSIMQFNDGIKVDSSGVQINIGGINVSYNNQHGINALGWTGGTLSLNNCQANYNGNAVGAADSGITVALNTAFQRLTIGVCTAIQTGGGDQEYGILVDCNDASAFGAITGCVTGFNTTGGITITGTSAANVVTAGNV